MTEPDGEITRLARRWSAGDAEAFDHLIELVYDDLRTIARKHLRSNARDQTIDTTVLVHEAYLKLARLGDSEWLSRGRFFAFCSQAMRRILIDYARERGAEKRGGDRVRVTLGPRSAVVDQQVTEVIALDEALTWLARKSPRLARVAECRFFGGLSVQETAEALETSPRTVERDWAKARGYLAELLGDSAEGNGR